ncbi:glycoside hydrolase family 2 TIM barrel-domain containing protein [Pelagicoccus albus]|uniref:Glycoside hydrolase family 2 catalytic domain-containing protein n=1 Tax=Pelagicoccus albus TaxID=415222 RepID=A0A7X1B651_9BACT|nr:hypothetical protein [Pelagicoccus albus]
MARLAEAGGNSLRTWGTDQTELVLPEIRKFGLTLCAGLWLTPPRQGFDYADEAIREAQFEDLKRQIKTLCIEPSLLVWGVGNELELGVSEQKPEVWKAVEEVAAFIKGIDPNRPVMTVLASVDEVALQYVQAYCPSLDFVSFNSYGDLESVQTTLDRIGWDKPYLVTEWGANGHWEVSQTTWGAEIEPSSADKADQIRKRFRKLNGSNGQCLGSYVFLWGSKQERTPTWYGLFDSEGRSTEAVDAISSLWRGVEERSQCPRISHLTLNSQFARDSVHVEAGSSVEAACEVSRGEACGSDLIWSVARESNDKKVGGDWESASECIILQVEELGEGRIRFCAPMEEGAYRLYVNLGGPGKSFATANIPFWVNAIG